VDRIACTLTCIALLLLTSWDKVICLNADTKYTIITAIVVASEILREDLRLIREQGFPRTKNPTQQEVLNMGNTMQLRMFLAHLLVQPVLLVLYFYGPVEYHTVCVCGLVGLYVVHLRNYMLLTTYTKTVSTTYNPSPEGKSVSKTAADPPPQTPMAGDKESVTEAVTGSLAQTPTPMTGDEEIVAEAATGSPLQTPKTGDEEIVAGAATGSPLQTPKTGDEEIVAGAATGSPLQTPKTGDEEIVAGAATGSVIVRVPLCVEHEDAHDPIQSMRLDIPSCVYVKELANIEAFRSKLINQCEMHRVCINVQVALIMCSLLSMCITPGVFKVLL